MRARTGKPVKTDGKKALLRSGYECVCMRMYMADLGCGNHSALRQDNFSIYKMDCCGKASEKLRGSALFFGVLSSPALTLVLPPHF